MSSPLSIEHFADIPISDWKPHEIRDLGANLIRLADAMDRNAGLGEMQSAFRWPRTLARIEQNAGHLAAIAQETYDRRRARRKYIPAQLLGEPAWDMLLELFVNYASGAKVPVTSLCIAANAPESTTLRFISLLVDEDLVRRSASAFDKRVIYVELTDKGLLTVGSYLDQC